VAGRGADGGRCRGGESIQAPRPRRARVASGAVAVLAAAALAAYPAAQDLRFQWAALAFAALAVLLLTAGLVARSPSALGFGLAALGADYAVLFVAEGGALDRFTPAYAAGFMLVAELAFWSIERRVPAWSEPAVAELRLARLAGACIGAALLGVFVLVVAAAATGTGGLALESLGVVAAVGALALITVLVRRRALDQTSP
jgi:hypothetical protein